MKAVGSAISDKAQWPDPAEHCGVCTALDVERSEAYDDGDFRTVAQVNQEIRNHPHLRRRPKARVQWSGK